MAISAPVDYRPLDDINADLCDIRDRLGTLESTVYAAPHAVTPLSPDLTLKQAKAAMSAGIDRYIDLGIIDIDTITRIARLLIVERVTVAEREGRL